MYNQFQNIQSIYNNSKPQNITDRSIFINQNKEIAQNIFTPYYLNQYIERENYSTRQKYQNPNIENSKTLIKRRIGDEKAKSERESKINFSNKIMSPKSSYHFSYIPIVNNQEDINEYNFKKQKIEKQNNNTNFTSLSIKPQLTNYSSIDPYWKRRGIETQNKINEIKNQLLEKEMNECKDRPSISKKSIEIAKKKNKDNVFERLNSEKLKQKHNEEIKKIAERNNKNKSPEINENSKKIKRNIQDLYQWKNKIDTKKNEKINKQILILNEERFVKTNKKSQNILNERKPDYISKKIEDRLLEQGKLVNLKKEEEKELYLESVSKPNYLLSNPNVNPYLVSERLFKSGQKINSNNNSINKQKKYNRSLSTLHKKKSKKKISNLNIGDRTNSESNISRKKKNSSNLSEYSNNKINKSHKNISIDSKNNKTPNISVTESNKNINYKNNKELIEIRRQLNEFYDMKKQFDYNITEYKKNNFNPSIQNTIKNNYHNYKYNFNPTTNNQIENKSSPKNYNQTQTQYQTIPSEYNTINTSNNLSQKKINNQNQNKIPVSTLLNKIMSNNNKENNIENGNPFDYVPKYNFNFGVANICNQRKDNNDAIYNNQYDYNFDYRANNVLHFKNDFDQ